MLIGSVSDPMMIAAKTMTMTILRLPIIAVVTDEVVLTRTKPCGQKQGRATWKWRSTASPPHLRRIYTASPPHLHRIATHHHVEAERKDRADENVADCRPHVVGCPVGERAPFGERDEQREDAELRVVEVVKVMAVVVVEGVARGERGSGEWRIGAVASPRHAAPRRHPNAPTPPSEQPPNPGTTPIPHLYRREVKEQGDRVHSRLAVAEEQRGDDERRAADDGGREREESPAHVARSRRVERNAREGGASGERGEGGELEP